MASNRREFLKSLGAGMGSLGVLGLSAKDAQANIKKKLNQVRHKSASEIAADEDFWFQVQQAFNVDRSVINLNNGGVHPAPKIVIDAVQRYMNFSNGSPVFNSWKVLRPRKELIRKKIADTFGCSPDEIAMVRNVTEALQNALMGLELKAGDEVLTTTHDYPSMKNALYQREKREGIVVKTFPFNYPPKSMKEIVDQFEKNITSKTKLFLVCHITNLTGQIFPIREICQVARSRGVEVVIDGAHAFGHFTFMQKDLDCDIYGANLHKWAMCPIGTGFLYIKKNRIKDIWPLFPAPEPQGDDIRKFEHIGTHAEYLKLAIGDALGFHHGIGPKRKEERLRYLRNYWAKKLEKLPRVTIQTSYSPEMSCGIAAFSVKDMDMGRLGTILFDRHKIIVTPIGIPSAKIDGERVGAIRVTPSIYSTLREIDQFVEAVTGYVEKGLPAPPEKK